MYRAREKPLCIISSCYKSFYFKIPKPEDAGECSDMYFVDCNETHEQYMTENLKASSFSSFGFAFADFRSVSLCQ